MSLQGFLQGAWVALALWSLVLSMARHGKPVRTEESPLYISAMWNVIPGVVLSFLWWWGMGFWSAPVQPGPQVAWVVIFVLGGLFWNILNHGKVDRYNALRAAVHVAACFGILIWSGLFHL